MNGRRRKGTNAEGAVGFLGRKNVGVLSIKKKYARHSRRLTKG